MRNIFRFILFYRITYDPFRSIKIKITTFDRLGFMFVVGVMHRRKGRVYKRKTPFGQPNTCYICYEGYWKGYSFFERSRRVFFWYFSQGPEFIFFRTRSRKSMEDVFLKFIDVDNKNRLETLHRNRFYVHASLEHS